MVDLVSQILGSIGSTPAAQIGPTVDEIIGNVVNAPAPNVGAFTPSAPKPQILSPDQVTGVAVAATRGPGANRNVEKDLTTLDDSSLDAIYGPNFSNVRDEVYNELQSQKEILGKSRDTNEVIGNAVTGFGAGYVGLVGDLISIGSLAGGKLDELAGTRTGPDLATPAIVQTKEDLVNFILSGKSQTSLDKDRILKAQSDYENSVNQKEADAAIAAGGNYYLENLKNLGKDFMDSGEIYTSDPGAVGDIIAGALGSLGPSAKVVSIAGNLVTKSGAYRAAIAADLIDSTAISKLMALSAKGTKASSMVGAVGLTEAASAYTSTLQDTMDRSHEDLASTSPTYFHLVENGMSREAAKAQVANLAAEEAFRYQLPMAMATSLLSLGFDANPLGVFKGKSMIEGLGQVGGQYLEEGAQSMTGQIAQNKSQQDYVDPVIRLLKDVGTQGAMGAIGGAGMAGVIGAPSIASSALSEKIPTPIAPETPTGVGRKDTVDSWGTDQPNTLTPEKTQMSKNQQEFDYKVATGAKVRLATLEAMSVQPTDGTNPLVPAVILSASQKAELRFLRENIDKPENLKAAYGIVNNVNERLPEDPGGPVKSDSTLAAEEQAKIDAALAKQKTRDEWVSWIKNARDTVLKTGTENLKAGAKATYEVAQSAVEKSAPVVKAAVDSPLVQSAKEKVTAGFNKGMTVAGPIIEAGKDKAADLANKVSSSVNDEIKLAAAQSETLTRDWIGNNSESSLPKGVVDIVQAAESDTPADLSGVVAPNTDVLSTVNNIVRGLSDSKISARKLSDSAVLYVQAHVAKLRAALPTLPADVRKQVEKVLASPQLAYVGERLKDIDMSKAVGKTTADVVRMARLNPTNVNPDEIDRILKQDNKDLSDEDVANLKAARDMSAALDNHRTRKVRVVEGDNGVSLGAKKTGSDEGMTGSELSSRSVQVDGFQGFRSIGQYGSDIMKGFQNPDGTFVDKEGLKNSNKISKQFEMLVQHMINKVDALNRSYNSAAPNSRGKVLGPNLGYDSFYKGSFMVPAGDARAAVAVAYHPGDEGSTKNAQAVYNDATAAVEVYNILVERFPEKFPEGKKTLSELVGIMKDITPKEPAQAKGIQFSNLDEIIANGVGTLIITENGEAVKFKNFALSVDGRFAEVGIVEKNFSERKGIGYDTYVALGKALAAKGIILQSSDTLLGHGRFLWEKLWKNDEAHFNDKSGRFQFGKAEAQPAPEAKPKEMGEAKAVEPKEETTLATIIDDEVSPLGETSEEVKTNPRDSLPQIFRDTFTEKAEKPAFQNGRELLEQVQESVDYSDGFVDFARKFESDIANRMNERLKTRQVGSNDKTPVLDALKKNTNLVKIKRFKSLMFVNPETGKYDPEILGLSVVMIMDFLSGAHSSSAAMLQDEMEENRIIIEDMTEQQVLDYMASVSIRQTVETMARKLADVLNLDVNQDAKMVDIRGALEGLLKEIITATSEATNLIEIRKVPVKTVKYIEKIQNDDGTVTEEESTKNALTPVIIITDKLKEAQSAIGLSGKNAVSEFLGEERILPTIGKPPTTVAQTQNRNSSKLSTTEKEVLNNMQAIPHTLADVNNLVINLGPDVIFNLLGGKDAGVLHKNHPYRRSIEGKNLSIKNDYDDAMDIINSILGYEGDEEPAVFYPMGITKVGRHQMKGPNPQNNKILRILVTPTHSTLDMENNQDHKNWFWLAVAQASGLSKAEKDNHQKIYDTTEAKFKTKFGDAVELVLENMRSGELIDKAAFIKAMDPHRKDGAITMAQISAIFAVASLEFAKTKNDPEALQKFETSLSFEIDGITDGPGNMMVNFGQGVLTEQDFENLRRIGYFLGEQGMTTNEYYSQKNLDVYEKTTISGEFNMSRIRNTLPNEVDAIMRFAARFGDLVMVGDKVQMTRNTAKGPVTKTGYGAAPKGIATGLAQEMINEFHKKMIEIVGKNDPSVVLSYPEFKEDFKVLFNSEFPESMDWKQSWIDKNSQDSFAFLIENTLAKSLSEAAKHTIGERIRKVNDSLVFISNVQALFLKEIFQNRLDGLLTTMRLDKVEQLPLKEYLKLVKEIAALASSYFNGIQTLNIGSFEGNVSDTVEFSDNFDENMRMKSTLLEPGDAGVKIIPYVTIGRGDAMMMNFVFERSNSPKKAIPIYDGIEIPITEIGNYSQLINEGVAENWKQDVLGNMVDELVRFMDSIGRAEMPFLEGAFEVVRDNQRKENRNLFISVESMLEKMKSFSEQNRARKKVFESIPRSINHMAGANKSVDLGPEGKMSLDEINDLIEAELYNPTPVTKEEEAKAAYSFSSLSVSSGRELLNALAQTKMNKRLAAVVGVLRKSMPNVRVVTGSSAQILSHRQNEGVTNATIPIKGQGFFDPMNQTIYLVSTSHETLVHELVHFSTFALVQTVYEGNGTVQQQDSVKRLESLMTEFLDMDFSKASKSAQRAAKTAKGEILRAQGMNDVYGKAKALNEFMAWSLANEALGRELSNTVVGTIVQMIKKVRLLMARILGTVAYDMFSNILFNTGAILDQSENSTPPSMEIMVDGKTKQIPVEDLDDGEVLEDWDGNFGGNNNDGGNGDNGSTNGGNQSPAEITTNFWIKLITKKIDEIKTPGIGRKKKLAELRRYVANAEKTFNDLLAGSYNFNYEQELTFKAIHMVLAFELNLNPNSLVAMNRVFSHVTDNLAPAMFAVNGQDKYQAMMNSFGGTKNTQGVSDAIAAFFALSQTSSDFRNALDQLPKPEVEGGIRVSSFNEFIASMSAVMMRQAVGEIQTGGVEAKEALDALSLSILEQDTNREFTALRGLMSTFDMADRFASGALRKIAEFGESMNRMVPDEQKLLKTVSQSVQLATGLLDERRAAESFEAAKLLTHMGTDLSWAIPFREFIAEIIGTDKNNTNLVAMLDITKKHVAALRQKYRDNLPIILQSEFKNKPTPEQWKAVHSSMGQSDFASVFELSKSDASFKAFSDQAYRGRQIQNLEQTIKRQVSRGVATEILEKAQQLAAFMNGQGAGHQLLVNAFVINYFVGDRTNEDLVSAINKLVTYYAIDSKPQTELDMVSAMYEADPQAMKNLVVYMQALNLEEERKLQHPPKIPAHLLDEQGEPLYGDPVMKMKLNGYKGYVPNFGMPDIQLTIEDDIHQDLLAKRGFVRVADYLGEDGMSFISRGIYKTSTRQNGGYAQGVMQSIQNTYRGVNAVTGLTVNGTTSGVIKGIDLVESYTEALNNSGTVNDPKEVLRPVWDENGVAFYERVINPDVISMHMAPLQNLALMLGVWAGRQIEEKAAEIYNNLLVDELRKIYDDRGAMEAGMFIDIREEARKMNVYNRLTPAQQKTVKKPDAIYADSWNVIPPQTKFYIQQVFPEGFMVRKDQINTALGYAEPSIVDVWTGKTRLSNTTQNVMQAVSNLTLGKMKNGTSAMTILQKGEEGVQSTVSFAKDLIVVRSVVVPYLNSQANVFNLVMRGVANKSIIKGYRDTLVEIEQYNENFKKRMYLELQVQLNREDSNRMQILKDQIQVLDDQDRRMKIWPLLEAGAYKTISEDITDDDFEVFRGGFMDLVDKQVDKLPQVAQTIVKNGVLSHDTKIYQLANKAVQYGDFIAKQVYYEHLLSQGKTSKEALATINEEFVNFSTPPGRVRTGLDKLGATFFMTYKIRVIKPALSQIRNNPVRALIVNVLDDDGTNTAQDSNLLTSTLDGRIGYSLGWGMLFNSTGLNPWANMMGW